MTTLRTFAGAVEPMSYLHPFRLSYTIEHETGVTLDISGLPGSFQFALDRFAADEDRFRMGLMAVLETESFGQLYVGYNARRAVSCLGYSTKEDVERYPHSMPDRKFWAEGGGVGSEGAEFHWFVPDCPSVLPPEFLTPFSKVCELAVAFLESGKPPESVKWVLNRGGA